MAKKVLATFEESTLPVTLSEPTTRESVMASLRLRFGLSASLNVNVQYYDKDWDCYVDVEEFESLVDKTKLRIIKKADTVDKISRTPVCGIKSTEYTGEGGTGTFTVIEVSELSSTSPAPLLNKSAERNSVEHESSDLYQQGSSTSNFDETVHNRTWPDLYDIKMHLFSSQVTQALHDKVDLKKPKHRYVRGMFVQSLVSDAMKFTTYPKQGEKRDMAKAIIRAFPHLTEMTGNGYSAWYESINDCLKNVRRNMKHVPEVAAKKRKVHTEASQSLRVSLPSNIMTTTAVSHTTTSPSSATVVSLSSAEENVTAVENRTTEGTTSLLGSTTVLESDSHTSAQSSLGVTVLSTSSVPISTTCSTVSTSKTTTAVKPGRISDVMKNKRPRKDPMNDREVSNEVVCAKSEMLEIMKLSEHERDEVRLRTLLNNTYKHRQALILSKANVSSIRSQYPAMFTRDGLLQDYLKQSPTNTDIMQSGRKALVTWSLMITNYTESMKNRGAVISSKISDCLRELCAAAGDNNSIRDKVPSNHRVICGLMLLSCHLQEDLHLFIKECPLTSTIEDLKSTTLTPHLVSIGSPCTSTLLYIVADGHPVLRVENLFDGVILLVISYFVLATEYPSKAKCTYSFLQEQILDIKLVRGTKSFPKLVRFIEKVVDN